METKDRDESARSRRPAWARLVGLAAVLAILVFAARTVPVDDWIPVLRGWIADAGPWGPAAFLVVYVVATNLGFPGTPLTISAGVLFGWWVGTAVSVASSTVSCCVMFAIARRLGRDALRAWIGERRTIARIDRLLARRGAWAVALSRLVPFPFLVLNYAFGFTSVPFRTYAAASAVGMIPWNVVFVTGGDAAARWLERGQTPWTAIAVLAGTAALAALLAWYARGFLRADR